MGNYRNLRAWQQGMELVDQVYVVIRSFPKSEMFGLSQQMRAAAISIPSNLAEGSGRYSIPEEKQFARHARGSTYELQTQIEIAARQGFITSDDAMNLQQKAGKVGRLINAYIGSLKPRTKD